MKIVTGYQDGHTVWSDLGPGATHGPHHVSGSLVVGHIPSRDDEYNARKQREYKARKRAEKAAQ